MTRIGDLTGQLEDPRGRRDIDVRARAAVLPDQRGMERLARRIDRDTTVELTRDRDRRDVMGARAGLRECGRDHGRECGLPRRGILLGPARLRMTPSA